MAAWSYPFRPPALVLFRRSGANSTEGTMASQDEIRLTRTSYAVLGLIRVFGQGSPYDLKRWIGNSVENFWPVPHTTAYSEPERLTRGGYLVERREERGRRRRLYQITERGREALEAF